MIMDLTDLRIGYVPISDKFDQPGDNRRFCYYAKKRNIAFEIANPSERYDLVIVTQLGDLSIWSEYDKGNTKIVYDFIDSYLAISRWNLKGLLRGIAKYVAGHSRYLRINHWKAIESMCRRANAVICSTVEQRQDITKFCENIHIILDFHSKITRHVKTDYSIGHQVNLVWEGRPENVTGIAQIKEALVQLSNKYRLSLHIITDLEYKKYMNKIGKVSTVNEIRRIFNDSIVYLYQWNPEMLSRIITGCDIAVIPLNTKDSLTYGKPENKLLLFWRMGIPTVTSATPAYIRAMDKCGLQLYCQDNKEWVEKLEKLIVDSKARKYAGMKGKKCADTFYSQEHYLKQWDNLLQSVLT